MSVEFACIWKKNESPDRLKAISLWERFNTFPGKEVTDTRSKEIVFVAKQNNEIIAISTARPAQIKLLNNNWFYEFRVFVSPESQFPQVILPLTLRTKEFLQQLSNDQPNSCIGLIGIIQNEKMNKLWRRAHWPIVDFFFAGYDSAGQQIRVSYFKIAKIE